MALASTSSGLHEQENFLPHRQVLLVIFTLGTTLAIINFDHKGLSTLLPAIAEDLEADQSITWAGSASLIATTVFSVLYGRFSDIFGRKAVFVSALAVFGIAELGCGFATSPSTLYVLRALAGASGGGIGNLTAIIATDTVSLRQRGKYMAFMAPFTILGNVCGPLFAAGFVRSTITWRGFFWFLSPLSGLAALLVIYMLPSTAPTDTFKRNLAKVDWLGSFTSTIAIVALMIPISGAGTLYQWNSPLVIALLSISMLAFLIFLLVEWKIATLPILPLTLFTNTNVSALLFQALTLGWINQANIYFIPLYAQNLRRWSPILSGAMLLPVIALQVLVSMLAGRWMSKSGRYGRTIRLGVSSLLFGSLMQTQLDRYTHPAIVALVFSAIGVGIGAANQPILVAMQAHTRKSERAVITSTRNFFLFLGSASGVTVSSAVFQSTLRVLLPNQYKHLADSPYALGKLDEMTRREIMSAYEGAIRHVFVATTGVAVLCSLGLLVWRDYGYEARPAEEEEEEGEQYAPVEVPVGKNKYVSVVSEREIGDEESRLFGGEREETMGYGAVLVEGRDDCANVRTARGGFCAYR